MTEFIDRFPEIKDRESGEHRRMQNTIVQLLEHISEGVERETSMPDRAQADELKDDLSDKSKEFKAAQVTQERLQEYLSLRQTELDKISTLDIKIAEEIRSLEERMEKMRIEMPKFGDIDGLKVAAETAQNDLRAKLKEYARRRDLMRQQMAILGSDYDRRKQILGKDPQASQIEAIETKLKNYEQTVFTLKEFIAGKAREVDYEALHRQVMVAMTELNGLIQKSQKSNIGTAGF